MNFIGVKTRYNDWFEDMVKVRGFTENVDFIGFTEKRVKPQAVVQALTMLLNLTWQKKFQ